MTLPYNLQVQFEEPALGGAWAATATVTVSQDCTCRKLLLQPGTAQDGQGRRLLQLETPTNAGLLEFILR